MKCSSFKFNDSGYWGIASTPVVVDSQELAFVLGSFLAVDNIEWVPLVCQTGSGTVREPIAKPANRFAAF